MLPSIQDGVLFSLPPDETRFLFQEKTKNIISFQAFFSFLYECISGVRKSVFHRESLYSRCCTPEDGSRSLSLSPRGRLIITPNSLFANFGLTLYDVVYE